MQTLRLVVVVLARESDAEFSLPIVTLVACFPQAETATAVELKRRYLIVTAICQSCISWGPHFIPKKLLIGTLLVVG